MRIQKNTTIYVKIYNKIKIYTFVHFLHTKNKIDYTLKLQTVLCTFYIRFYFSHIYIRFVLDLLENIG